MGEPAVTKTAESQGPAPNSSSSATSTKSSLLTPSIEAPATSAPSENNASVSTTTASLTTTPTTTKIATTTTTTASTTATPMSNQAKTSPIPALPKTALSSPTKTSPVTATTKTAQATTKTTPVTIKTTPATTKTTPVTPSPNKTPVSTPTKRKSRSTSLESNPPAPAPKPAAPPAKRQRKKKADTIAKPADQSSVISSLPTLNNLSNSTQLQTNSTPTTLSNTAPLMINTTGIGNRLMPGLNSGETQDTGNRYFSPLPSPYTNFDHQLAPRSSLSRLFTSSSANNNLSNSSTATKTPKATPTKRKSRSTGLESKPEQVAPVPIATPAKRQRKKKTDTVAKPADHSSVINSLPTLNNSINSTQLQPNTTPNTLISTGPLMINTPVMNNRLLPGLNSGEAQDTGNRYYSPLPSPYTNYDHQLAPRSNLSRLFNSSLSNNFSNSADDPAKAFEELRENTWSHLSRCVLEQAQQFDIPSLIGTLYTIRSENEKLVNKVRDLTMKRDQLIAMNARLDLPGPMLTQHLNNTSPNFASLVSGLTNSPKSMPSSSPSAAIAKQPLVSVGSFNHVPPGSLGPPGFLDRSSPLVSQTHSGINNINK